MIVELFCSCRNLCNWLFCDNDDDDNGDDDDGLVLNDEFYLMLGLSYAYSRHDAHTELWKFLLCSGTTKTR